MFLRFRPFCLEAMLTCWCQERQVKYKQGLNEARESSVSNVTACEHGHRGSVLVMSAGSCPISVFADLLACLCMFDCLMC